MATSQEVKDAADAVATAKANLAAAEAEATSKELEALALVPNEIASRNAAVAAFDAALDTARGSVGWHAANGALQDAILARDEAVETLITVAAAYEGL